MKCGQVSLPCTTACSLAPLMSVPQAYWKGLLRVPWEVFSSILGVRRLGVPDDLGFPAGHLPVPLVGDDLVTFGSWVELGPQREDCWRNLYSLATKCLEAAVEWSLHPTRCILAALSFRPRWQTWRATSLDAVCHAPWLRIQ